jgi:hypothetical protein
MRRSSFYVTYRRHDEFDGIETRHFSRFEKDGESIDLRREILDRLFVMKPRWELDGKRIRVTVSVVD